MIIVLTLKFIFIVSTKPRVDHVWPQLAMVHSDSRLLP